MRVPVTVFWFRRDLRVYDNAGLFRALCSSRPVLPVYIVDTDTQSELAGYGGRRAAFVRTALDRLQGTLARAGSGLRVYCGKPVDVFRALAEEHAIAEVWANEEYEPSTRRRDSEVAALLKEHGIPLKLQRDHVIHDVDAVLTAQGTPFRVFTAYKAQWIRQYAGVQAFPSESALGNLVPGATEIPPDVFGAGRLSVPVSSPDLSVEALSAYAHNRDIPAREATTRLGAHLRFGTVSVRDAVRAASEHSATLLSELIWREFFTMVLYHRPDVATSCYRREYNAVQWRNNDEEFRRWCEGRTGYPLVDAGMRQLNATGYMHNRVRMVAAGFLVKDLLIDWRWGESYFAHHLLDYELASNNGNWQWVAGTGCDAAPYFRVFNPETQRKRFDPDDAYCRRWIPELGTEEYPAPIVDHAEARKRAIRAYAEAVAVSTGTM